ncbi:MAG: hypothetical protein KF685_07865 [Acidobacteria bacterium]|nr:hypothetical protein [Acidobacteriota bacterium]
MRNRALGNLALGILVIVGSGCFFNSCQTTAKGVVMNYGKPLENAEVSFGPTLGEVKAFTDKDGKFELTAWHRPTAMLYVTVKKKGYAQREKIEFPGFASPGEEIRVEMLETIGYSDK